MRQTYTQDNETAQSDAVQQADTALGVIEGVASDTCDHNASTTSFCTASNTNITKDKGGIKEIPEFTERQIRRFWEQVQKTDGCWLWTGYQGAANPAKTIFYGAYRGFKVHRIS